MPPVALTIAGSDPSGGAGLQGDLKTFHQFNVYGEAVPTLITVQNSLRVSRVEMLDPALVREQLEAVVEDIPPAAAKSGALGSAAMVRMLAQASADWKFPLVVDPVMVSKHGHLLLDQDAVRALRAELLPRAFLVTPNLPEAAAITGLTVTTFDEMRRAADAILTLGARAVLLKGGHLPGDSTDLLYDGVGWHEFPAPRLPSVHTHGTGCALSAAITARLARGDTLAAAVAHAKQWIHEAIRTAPGLGRGSGPLNHHAEVK